LNMSAATQFRQSFQTLNMQPGEDLAYKSNYNRRPFVMRHQLSDHPLLQLSRLKEVAQLLAKEHPARLYHDVGRQITDRGWDFTTERPFSAEEAMQRIETSDSWMILKGIQMLPEYGKLLDDILRDIHEASGRNLDRDTRMRNISLIVTSPNRITPYHMDPDCNYLLQIVGSKTVYVFNGDDRNVVTPGELERFYTSEMNAAQYKEASQDGAWRFELGPGMGVHVPVVFPHWVKNGDNVSISASINFRFADNTVPDIYRLNHYLRKAGLTPKPPGESAISDGVKKLVSSTIRIVRKPHD
jgi:hypothetical protein